jgi:hypothetical protein
MNKLLVSYSGTSATATVSRCLLAMYVSFTCSFVNGANSTQSEQSLATLGKKLSNPVSDVWALFTEVDFNFNSGDLVDDAGSDYKNAQALIIEPMMPIGLTENWKLVNRPTLPILSNPIPEVDSHNVSFDRKDGIGDLSIPMMLSLKVPGTLTWALGPTFSFPTASATSLGTNHYEVGPAALLLYKNPKITVGALTQYWWSYKDQNDATTNDSSHGEIIYFYYYNLPDAWQVGFNPTITYDNEASSGNKWNVPVGIVVGKMLKFGKTPVKIQVGFEYAAVQQDDYGTEWRFKIDFIPVVKPLISGDLF